MLTRYNLKSVTLFMNMIWLLLICILTVQYMMQYSFEEIYVTNSLILYSGLIQLLLLMIYTIKTIRNKVTLNFKRNIFAVDNIFMIPLVYAIMLNATSNLIVTMLALIYHIIFVFTVYEIMRS